MIPSYQLQILHSGSISSVLRTLNCHVYCRAYYLGKLYASVHWMQRIFKGCPCLWVSDWVSEWLTGLLLERLSPLNIYRFNTELVLDWYITKLYIYQQIYFTLNIKTIFGQVWTMLRCIINCIQDKFVLILYSSYIYGFTTIKMDLPTLRNHCF